jgi:hypothetical protein
MENLGVRGSGKRILRHFNWRGKYFSAEQRDHESGGGEHLRMGILKHYEIWCLYTEVSMQRKLCTEREWRQWQRLWKGALERGSKKYDVSIQRRVCTERELKMVPDTFGKSIIRQDYLRWVKVEEVSIW